MITEAARRLLCRAGRHHVVRCAGAEDHRWSWDEARQRWTAVLVPPSARPAWRLDPVTPGRGEPTTPGGEEPVAPDPDPVTVDPAPVTGCCPHTPGGPHSVLCTDRAFYRRADELIARGDVEGYLQMLRDTDRVGADQGVLADPPPAGKNDLVGGRHRG